MRADPHHLPARERLCGIVEFGPNTGALSTIVSEAGTTDDITLTSDSPSRARSRISSTRAA